jgi:hypothetical protein
VEEEGKKKKETNAIILAVCSKLSI